MEIPTIACKQQMKCAAQRPLVNAELELFLDGSASIDQHTVVKRAGYAAVTQHKKLKAEPLPTLFSVRAAELKALTEAYKLAKGKQLLSTQIAGMLGGGT